MQPFSGIRVIDLSPNQVGAQVSQLFADFGADVIQVERPGGASIREHGAYPFWARGKRSIVVDMFNSDADRDVTILELATLFAAPHGTTMLTDLGARVIKVEPLAGDRIRNIISFPESGGLKVMQGKESIAIDLTTPEGLAIINDIASKVDVVVQGYRAGAMGRLGLDYQTIKLKNPNVIYVNAPGYGVDGPYSGQPAYAPSIGAAAGLPLINVGQTVPEGAGLDMTQIRDGARRLSAASAMSNAQADGFAALGVATAILFGLSARAYSASTSTSTSTCIAHASERQGNHDDKRHTSLAPSRCRPRKDSPKPSSTS